MINLDYTFDDKYTNSTFCINAVITDPETGDLIDPTAVIISIQDPTGNLYEDGVDMIHDSLGKYHYDTSIPTEIGAYRGEQKSIDVDGKVTIKTFGFWAEASL